MEQTQQLVQNAPKDSMLHVQANFCDLNRNIRDLHEKCQQNSAHISRLRENSAANADEFITRTEFQEVMSKMAQMDHLRDDYHSFKQEVGVIMIGVDNSLKNQVGAFHKRLDQFDTNFGAMDSELQRCKSLLDLKVQNPPPQAGDDSQVSADFIAWSKNMHGKLCDVMGHVQQLKNMALTHDR